MNVLLYWLFGALCIGLGIMNLLRGNDPEFGLFLLIISTIYLPPTSRAFTRLASVRIHPIMKVLLALGIIWANLAVGAINEGYYPEITG